MRCLQVCWLPQLGLVRDECEQTNVVAKVARDRNQLQIAIATFVTRCWAAQRIQQFVVPHAEDSEVSRSWCKLWMSSGVVALASDMRTVSVAHHFSCGVGGYVSFLGVSRRPPKHGCVDLSHVSSLPSCAAQLPFKYSQLVYTGSSFERCRNAQKRDH